MRAAGQSVANNVGDADAEFLPHGEDVEVVAAHVSGGAAFSGDGEAGKFGQIARQETALYGDGVLQSPVADGGGCCVAVRPASTCLLTMRSRWSLSQGFWTKSHAPRCMASTARSMLPQAVMATTGHS